MAKNEGAFTKVPNWILDDTSLNVYHKAVLVHIARQTIGYGKKSDGISISQFAKATGIGKTKIGQTLSELEKKRCIKVKRQTLSSGGKSFNRYSLPPYPPHGEPYPPHDEPHTRHTDIQKKIEQKREGERIISDEDKRAFIAYLIDGENIRST
jgi:predicted Zn-dependent protease